MQKNKDGFDFEPFAKTREYLKVNADIVTTWVGTMLKNGINRNRMETRPEASKFLPSSYYEQLVEEARFKIIDAKEFSVNLYKKAWEQISRFRQYAAGALHGYAPQEAATAMKNAVAIALANYGQKDEQREAYIPRKWLAISARL